MVRECQKAAQESGVSCEVVDLRTISPLDTETILNSVKKTGKVVIVHEAPKSFGVGAELIARINEKALMDLQAPIERVCGYDTVFPLFKLENEYLPSTARIVAAIKKVMSF